MSTHNFVHNGSGKYLLEVASKFGPVIKLYNIGEPLFLGVEYPGKDRQAQPIQWWTDVLAKEGFNSLIPKRPAPELILPVEDIHPPRIPPRPKPHTITAEESLSTLTGHNYVLEQKEEEPPPKPLRIQPRRRS